MELFMKHPRFVFSTEHIMEKYGDWMRRLAWMWCGLTLDSCGKN